MTGRRETSGEMLQGTLDLLILKLLARGKMHGYNIAEHIQQTSEAVQRVDEGARCPALHRVGTARSWLQERGVSENNRAGKYYKLTSASKRELSMARERWSRMTGAIARVLQGT